METQPSTHDRRPLGLSQSWPQYRQIAVAVTVLLGGGLLWLIGAPGWAHIVWMVGAACGALPLALEIYHSLRRGEFGVDIIAIAAILSALILREALVAVVIWVMLTGGEALENYANSRAKRELSSLLEAAPRFALRQSSRGHFSQVKVEDIRPRDVVQVRPGEVVPVDAVILTGSSSLDESALTGESLPLDVGKGVTVLSGAVNLTGVLELSVLRTSGDSEYEQIITLVRQAAESRSPLVRLADRYSLPFTLISFTLAGIAWAASGQFLRALEVLVVATPCPLLLAAPVAIVSGMSRAARYGIIVKNGQALEALASTRALAFDKTGTLTQGRPVVQRVKAYGVTKAEVLGWAAAVEAHSVHILATAIVTEAERAGLRPPVVHQVKEVPGRGLTAKLQGQRLVVGRASYLHELGLSFPLAEPEVQDKTTIWVARDELIVGYIQLTDELRAETPATLRALRHLGIKHLMLMSGDHQKVADQLAQPLHLDVVKGDLLPAGKVEAIQAWAQDYHSVGMVGDGVNDAPTLAAADVGIALGARGSTAASEAADVVIMLDDLRRVPVAISVARRAVSIARQSIFVGIGLSFFLMLVAMTGHLPPVWGAVLQECIDILVILNALRAHTGQLPLRISNDRAVRKG